MPASERFVQLQTRLETLKARFLGIKPNALGIYPAEAQDFARTYRVLAHAEVEAYIKARVDEIIKLVVKQWRANHAPHAVVVSMLASWNKDWTDAKPEEVPVPNKDLKGISANKVPVEVFVDRAFRAFQENSKRVYGLAPSNLNKLVGPLGIDVAPPKFDATWLAEMENFCIQRGTVAHCEESASENISPDDERRRMDILLPGMVTLDTEFNKLIV